MGNRLSDTQQLTIIICIILFIILGIPILLLSTCSARIKLPVKNTLTKQVIVSNTRHNTHHYDYHPETNTLYFSSKKAKDPESPTNVYRFNLTTGKITLLPISFKQIDYICLAQDDGFFIVGDRTLNQYDSNNKQVFSVPVISKWDLDENAKPGNEEYKKIVLENAKKLIKESDNFKVVGLYMSFVKKKPHYVPRYLIAADRDGLYALDVLKCGGYKVTEKTDITLLNLLTQYNEEAVGSLGKTFRIKKRNFRIDYVTTPIMILNLLYHNFDCEKSVNQVRFGKDTYQSGVCIRSIHSMPSSRYIFVNEDSFIAKTSGGISIFTRDSDKIFPQASFE